MSGVAWCRGCNSVRGWGGDETWEGCVGWDQVWSLVWVNVDNGGSKVDLR